MPATLDRLETGIPVMKSREEIAQKRRTMGLYNFSCQWLLSPEKAGSMGFELNWLRYWPADRVSGMSLYLFVDPASSKKATADFTTMGIIGLGRDRKKYFVDGLRERLNLKERTDKLFSFIYTYHPMTVYYEKYGMQSDIEHIEQEMDRRNYRFDLQAVGGGVAKVDRINRLGPDFENGVWYFPQVLRKVDPTGARYDLMYEFIHREFLEWPFPSHDDFMDMISRIYDVPLLFPDSNTVEAESVEIYKDDRTWEPLQMRGGWGR